MRAGARSPSSEDIFVLPVPRLSGMMRRILRREKGPQLPPDLHGGRQAADHHQRLARALFLVVDLDFSPALDFQRRHLKNSSIAFYILADKRAWSACVFATPPLAVTRNTTYAPSFSAIQSAM